MLTDKELSGIIKDMVIVIDTRENKNGHIIKFFEENGIEYEYKKLDFGDYTFRLKTRSDLNLDNLIVIERKNSLDEIAVNFTKNRDRFIREFERGNNKLHILVENGRWSNIFNSSYRSEILYKSFMASILTWYFRYNCPFWFVEVDNCGEFVYNLLKYSLLESLKKI